MEEHIIIDYLTKVQDILKNEKFKALKNYIQHGDTSIYRHVIQVSFYCYYKYCNNPKIDMDSLLRGALLHDFFLYDWHAPKKKVGRKGLHGFTHPKAAIEKANQEFHLNKKEKNIIRSHMWPLTLFHIPLSKEAWIVCLNDKIVAIKESFHKKDQDIDLVLKTYKKRCL